MDVDVRFGPFTCVAGAAEWRLHWATLAGVPVDPAASEGAIEWIRRVTDEDGRVGYTSREVLEEPGARGAA